jgi:hypothetical protein
MIPMSETPKGKPEGSSARTGIVVNVVSTVIIAGLGVVWQKVTQMTQKLELTELKVEKSLVDVDTANRRTIDIDTRLTEVLAKSLNLESELETQQKKASELLEQFKRLQSVNSDFETKLKAIEFAAKIMGNDDAQKIRDTALIKSEKVRKQMVPFFTPSMAVIGHSNSAFPNGNPLIGGGFQKAPLLPYYLVDDRRTATKSAPMSYELIASSGALESGDTGLKQLLHLAQIENDGRPNWPTPTTEKDWDELREVQNLLLLHGTLMVTEGLLAP